MCHKFNMIPTLARIPPMYSISPGLLFPSGLLLPLIARLPCVCVHRVAVSRGLFSSARAGGTSGGAVTSEAFIDAHTGDRLLPRRARVRRPVTSLRARWTPAGAADLA